MPFHDTKEGQTHYCVACEDEARGNAFGNEHTCGKKIKKFSSKKNKLNKLPSPLDKSMSELKYCKKCIQMTNHNDTRCLKCKPSQLEQDILEEFDEKFEYTELKDLDSGYSVLVDRKDNCPMGYIQIESFLFSSIAKVRKETLEEVREEINKNRHEPTLCGKCDLNGKLCKECYANRRANSALSSLQETLDKKLKE